MDEKNQSMAGNILEYTKNKDIIKYILNCENKFYLNSFDIRELSSTTKTGFEENREKIYKCLISHAIRGKNNYATILVINSMYNKSIFDFNLVCDNKLTLLQQMLFSENFNVENIINILKTARIPVDNFFKALLEKQDGKELSELECIFSSRMDNNIIFGICKYLFDNNIITIEDFENNYFNLIFRTKNIGLIDFIVNKIGIDPKTIQKLRR